jgi:hypothetical protein
MWSITTLLRLILSILVGITLIAVMPIYDEPFGGCAIGGYITLDLGCTLWLDVLLGFVIVSIVSWIGPNCWQPHVWGMALVILVASLGGISAIKSGVYLDIVSHPANISYYWKEEASLATLLGGILGIGFYYLLLYARSILD